MDCRIESILKIRETISKYLDEDQSIMSDFCETLTMHVEELMEIRNRNLSNADIELLLLIYKEYSSYLPDGYPDKILNKLYFLFDDLLIDRKNQDMWKILAIFDVISEDLKEDQSIMSDFCETLTMHVEELMEIRNRNLSNADIELLLLIYKEYSSYLPNDYKNKILDKLYFLFADLLDEAAKIISVPAHK